MLNIQTIMVKKFARGNLSKNCSFFRWDIQDISAKKATFLSEIQKATEQKKKIFMKVIPT